MNPAMRIIVLVLALLAIGTGMAWRLLMKPKAGHFGAIAISASSQDYGVAWGYPDALSAYKRSIAECTKAGSHDCVVKASLKDSCGALAISAERNASYLVTGRDQVQTTQLAMAQCQQTGATDCAVHENICSTGT